jgi:NAD(P)-dependent dehydrogenase (short-subunit alcohol dehydrogenase family)
MDLKLEGKMAFISGSSQGIGLAAASVLVREGAEVVINARTQERVDQAVSKIKGSYPSGKVTGIAADLGTAAGVDEVSDKVPEVDILVNNVGIFEPKEFADISDEEWYRFIDINIMSAIRLCRFYHPKMMTKKWGRIIFASSESALNIPPEMMHYGMTKTAMLSLSRGLAEASKGTEVTVNSILPGPTSTEGVSEFFKKLADEKGISYDEMIEDFFKTGRPNSILGRLIDPEEVANTIAFLCSPLAQATNGAAIRVDGGLIRSPM